MTFTLIPSTDRPQAQPASTAASASTEKPIHLAAADKPPTEAELRAAIDLLHNECMRMIRNIR